MLGGLGLQFAGSLNVRQPGDVHVKRVFAAHVRAHLAQRFGERAALDVTDGAADFHQHDFRAGGLGDHGDAALDFVGDVRDDLDGAAQVVAPPLLADHFGVDLPGGDVAHPVQTDINKALVVTQVEVGFGPVVQHEDFAVLVGAHGARIHVNVRIQLLHRHFEAALFEQAPGSCSGHALTNRADHAPSEKDVLYRHNGITPWDREGCVKK